MTSYLSCIKTHRGQNDEECRQLSKAYLKCRMDRNLMAVDEMKNLGYGDKQDSVKDGNEALKTVAERTVGKKG